MSLSIEDMEEEIKEMQQLLLNEQSRSAALDAQEEDYKEMYEDTKRQASIARKNIQRYFGGISTLQNNVNKLRQKQSAADAVNAEIKKRANDKIDKNESKLFKKDKKKRMKNVKKKIKSIKEQIENVNEDKILMSEEDLQKEEIKEKLKEHKEELDEL